MKLYTKTGDRGQTSLYGGERRAKSDQRIEAYGQVDELQACIGVALAVCKEHDELLTDIIAALLQVQYDSFVICCVLARPEPSTKKEDPNLKEERITWLEGQIDHFDTQVPALRSFIMQGGALPGAHLHVGRTVCRRAERAAVRLQEAEEVEALIITYLNRLSDLLFVLARVANHRLNQPEVAWKWH